MKSTIEKKIKRNKHSKSIDKVFQLILQVAMSNFCIYKDDKAKSMKEKKPRKKQPVLNTMCDMPVPKNSDSREVRGGDSYSSSFLKAAIDDHQIPSLRISQSIRLAIPKNPSRLNLECQISLARNPSDFLVWDPELFDDEFRSACVQFNAILFVKYGLQLKMNHFKEFFQLMGLNKDRTIQELNLMSNNFLEFARSKHNSLLIVDRRNISVFVPP